jgi:pimeloyl-ACP methyl ester carboxylesterase
VDVVLLTQWFSSIDSQWDVPPLAEFIRRLARFGRVLTFDKRGTGVSDPVPASELPSIEEWMDDLRTVMDDSGIDRAVLVTNLASSFMAMVFAATYPARVRALVMVNPYPRFTRADDYPWGFDAGNFDMVMERTRRTWGKGMLLRQLAPTPGGKPGHRYGDDADDQPHRHAVRAADDHGTDDGDIACRPIRGSGRAPALHRRSHPGRALRGACRDG